MKLAIFSTQLTEVSAQCFCNEKEKVGIFSLKSSTTTNITIIYLFIYLRYILPSECLRDCVSLSLSLSFWHRKISLLNTSVVIQSLPEQKKISFYFDSGNRDDGRNNGSASGVR